MPAGFNSSLRHLLRRMPIPVLAAIAGLAVGVAVWLINDQVQTKALRDIFQQESIERLHQHEHESLVRFDHFIQSYKATTRLLASHRRMSAYLDPLIWNMHQREPAVLHDYDPPPWLPDRAIWHISIPPSHVLLIDTNGHIREEYQVSDQILPEELLSQQALMFRVSDSSAFITKLGNQPYLLVFEMIEDQSYNVMGNLVMLVPIDSEFLLASQQRVNPNDAVYALLDAENLRVLASSDTQRIGIGAVSDQLKSGFELTMHSFGDYGDSDLNLLFTTFVPRSQLQAMGDRVLATERRHRLGGSVIIIAAFILSFVVMSSYINRLLKRLSKLSSHALGIDRRHAGWGNQLLILEDWIKAFIKLVMRSREETQRRHENQIRQSEALKTAIMDASLDSIITVGQDGDIVEFNPTAERTFGYARRQVLGKKLDALLLPASARAYFAELMGECTETDNEASVTAQMEAVTSEGRVFPVELAIKSIMLDEQRLLTVYIRDYSEHRRQQAQIISLAAFPGESPSPVLRVNRPGVVIYANTPSQPLLEYWGCEPLQTLPHYWRQQVREVLDEGRTRELEMQVGDTQYSLLMAPVRDLGYVNIYAHDITRMRQAEAEAQRRQNELVHVSRLSTMGEMATGIAHELNQPLSAIINYANGCMRRLRVQQEGAGDLLDALAQISGQAERAGEIIKRMRGMVTRQQPVREEHDLNDLITEVSALLTHDLRKAGVQLEQRVNPEPLMIRVDPVQIEQAVLNLARNGLDALQETEVERRRFIISTGHRENGMVYVSVRDSGPGMHPRELEHLFDPFYTTKQHGMGMGLAITQTIVEHHGGKIRVESWPGKGSTFTIELPVATEAMRSLAS